MLLALFTSLTHSPLLLTVFQSSCPKGTENSKREKNKKQPLSGRSHLYLNQFTTLPPRSFSSRVLIIQREPQSHRTGHLPISRAPRNVVFHFPLPSTQVLSLFPKDSPHVVLLTESRISPAKSHQLLDLCNDLSALSAFARGFPKQTRSTQKLEGP